MPLCINFVLGEALLLLILFLEIFQGETVKKKALIIGSTAVDVIIEIDSLPKTGDDVNTKSQVLNVGGCAYNVASMLSYLSKDFDLISPVGSGFYGDFINQTLVQKGFSVPLDRVREENGCCYCFVERGGERSFVCHRGAEYVFRDEFFKGINPAEYEIIYFCGLDLSGDSDDSIIRFLENATKNCTLNHPKLFFAPGPQIANIPRGILEQIFALDPMLHLSKSEYEVLSCEFGSAEDITHLTGAPLIITHGSEGAFLITPASCGINKVHVPSQPVEKIVDTIGAGDAHAGSVISCLLDGKTLSESIKFANTMAAKVIEIKGSTLLR